MIAGRISELLRLDVVISPHWGDIFVLMTLYLGARARAYWEAGARQHAAMRVLLGLIIAFFCSVLAGLWAGDGLLVDLGIVITVTLGLLSFDLLDALWASAMYRPSEGTFSSEFKRYLGFSLPTYAVAAGALVVCLFLVLVGALPASVRLALAFFPLLALSLIVYWATRGWHHAGEIQFRRPEENRWARFLRSSTTRISSIMLTVICGAILFFAMNAGHALFLG
jgi:hypothetical protein